MNERHELKCSFLKKKIRNRAKCLVMSQRTNDLNFISVMAVLCMSLRLTIKFNSITFYISLEQFAKNGKRKYL